MEMTVAIPVIWGNVFCVVLPAPPKGDQTKWNADNLAWIKKLINLSPVNVEPTEPPDDVA